MRHANHKYRLNVAPEHRKSMMKNLSVSILEHGKIKTTLSRAKALKSFIEKLVTLSKEDSVANRRLAYRKLNNREAVTRLFTEIGPKFVQRPGGYTRIYKLADGRIGDGAKLGIIAFVE